MFDLSNSALSSKRPLCRAIANICAFLGLGLLAGCMNSVPATLEASKQISKISMASYDKLNLSDELLADALTIQRVVTDAKTQNVTEPHHMTASADLPEGSSLDWENAATGSRGEISHLADMPSGQMICRNFKTSRLSFDGVSNYEGLTCQSSNGGWTLKSFQQIT